VKVTAFNSVSANIVPKNIQLVDKFCKFGCHFADSINRLMLSQKYLFKKTTLKKTNNLRVRSQQQRPSSALLNFQNFPFHSCDLCDSASPLQSFPLADDVALKGKSRKIL